MEMDITRAITVEVTVNAPLKKVWAYWTGPEHIVNWNFASDDWHSPAAINDLRPGGRFSYRMEARDGSIGFDFNGVYDGVKDAELLEYTMEDGRRVRIIFNGIENETKLTEIFEPENENPAEFQKTGWQAILDNFKKYAERKNSLVILNFSINIVATVEKVYHTMLADESYREWTSIFAPGSYFEGSWEKGSGIRFLAPDEKGNLQGMISRIKEHIPLKFVSIEHLGELKDGREDMSSAVLWSGALENYRFTAANGATLLEVEMEVTTDFQEYFRKTWPKALEKLKSMCES